MNNNTKSPIISLNVYDIKCQKEKKIKVSGRSFHSLSYRKNGKVKINTGKESFHSKTGCITFIPKDQSYSTKVIEDTRIIAIHFNVVDDTAFNMPFMLMSNSHHLEQLFDLVLKKYSAEDFNNYECYSYFYKILAELENLAFKKSIDKINPAVSKAKMMIEKNFRCNDFNIDSLVNSLNISASHLRSEFKRYYSVTPIEYLKNIRLQNAISLLASDYYSIEDIAIKSGYSSASYFIQTFRKSTGYSPLKYKEEFLSI